MYVLQFHSSLDACRGDFDKVEVVQNFLIGSRVVCCIIIFGQQYMHNTYVCLSNLNRVIFFNTGMVRF